MLAIASKVVIIGFNTGAEPGAKSSAEREGVSLRFYDIIYNMVDDVSKALKGMLTPTFVEVIDGHGEVRAVFTAGKKDKIAGVFITEGKVTRSSSMRVLRGKQKVYEGGSAVCVVSKMMSEKLLPAMSAVSGWKISAIFKSAIVWSSSEMKNLVRVLAK